MDRVFWYLVQLKTKRYEKIAWLRTYQVLWSHVQKEGRNRRGRVSSHFFFQGPFQALSTILYAMRSVWATIWVFACVSNKAREVLTVTSKGGCLVVKQEQRAYIFQDNSFCVLPVKNSWQKESKKKNLHNRIAFYFD